MALAVPIMPRWRASGSPDVVKVRNRRTAKPRATNICSPRDKERSSAGGGTQALLLAKAWGGNVGATL